MDDFSEYLLDQDELAERKFEDEVNHVITSISDSKLLLLLTEVMVNPEYIRDAYTPLVENILKSNLPFSVKQKAALARHYVTACAQLA